MYAHPRTVISSIIGLATAIVLITLFAPEGSLIRDIGKYSQLTAALVGGFLVLISTVREDKKSEPWIGRERLGWFLLGCGPIMWGLGEAFWRYYLSINQAPFPSLADIGYASFPPLVFAGLLLQPSSRSGHKRLLILLDSLISMGAILTIGWALLLGSLALSSTEANLAKFLGLYYPITDTALLSCVMFLLLRSQGGSAYQATARRVALLLVGIGLCFFVTSDFIFNVQQNAGTYNNTTDTWVDLGWPLGMLMIGIGGYLRVLLPATPPSLLEQRVQKRTESASFGLEQSVPYILVAVLFLILVSNVLSSDPGQRLTRPVLILASVAVVGLIITRQIITLRDNIRMSRQQTEMLVHLEIANHLIKDQSDMITTRNRELEIGIAHLKEVHAQLANGHWNARAQLDKGELLPLAGSVNLMAERLMRLRYADQYAQQLSGALSQISTVLERYRVGASFMLPSPYRELPEVSRLVLALEKIMNGHSVNERHTGVNNLNERHTDVNNLNRRTTAHRLSSFQPRTSPIPVKRFPWNPANKETDRRG